MEKYIQGDIHDVIKDIETNSIDLIYTNPPFGTTENEWDKPLRWNELWDDIWRVLKPNGVVVIHASKPFSYTLIQSQKPKYNYTWIKEISTGFFHAKKQPLRLVEEVYVFYKGKHTYNPQMIGDEYRPSGCASTSTYYGSRGENKKISGGHYGKYPTDVLKFKRDVRNGKTIGDDMIDFFIKTYSNEEDIILDMTTHSKVVGNRAINLSRHFIGVDLLEIK
jgi:site-specific DNA-methyltransferase (adenine-specific)